ncbi:hypothetical protein L596_007182 [Steinernema carpocapsae]|uniref:Uncharacterized protein n=1 Tax=Steinernema carpocapsae TaxID=34508 RepID=A0A4U5P8G5_STECR|nr:hypothetical protein L596_007182 [Steinernema carpocapsae]
MHKATRESAPTLQTRSLLWHRPSRAATLLFPGTCTSFPLTAALTYRRVAAAAINHLLLNSDFRRSLLAPLKPHRAFTACLLISYVSAAPPPYSFHSSPSCVRFLLLSFLRPQYQHNPFILIPLTAWTIFERVKMIGISAGIDWFELGEL